MARQSSPHCTFVGTILLFDAGFAELRARCRAFIISSDPIWFSFFLFRVLGRRLSCRSSGALFLRHQNPLSSVEGRPSVGCCSVLRINVSAFCQLNALRRVTCCPTLQPGINSCLCGAQIGGFLLAPSANPVIEGNQTRLRIARPALDKLPAFRPREANAAFSSDRFFTGHVPVSVLS